MFSAARIGSPHAGHALAGRTTERPSGTRAMTTLRNDPTASPTTVANTVTTTVTATSSPLTAALPRLPGFPRLPRDSRAERYRPGGCRAGTAVRPVRYLSVRFVTCQGDDADFRKKGGCR